VRVFEEESRTFELILVDDGRPDDVWSVIVSLHEKDPQRVVAVDAKLAQRVDGGCGAPGAG
jgi:glycosyltransferase involved in cell wall biosynthesis